MAFRFRRVVRLVLVYNVDALEVFDDGWPQQHVAQDPFGVARHTPTLDDALPESDYL
jgi:hypothetical protein